MTLTEFLLARIAEDEDTARAGFSHPDRWVHVAVPGANISVPNGLSCTAVLAECDAKRRIVERVTDSYFCGSPFDAEGLPRLLALPYANHPDYREEWRP